MSPALDQHDRAIALAQRQCQQGAREPRANDCGVRVDRHDRRQRHDDVAPHREHGADAAATVCVRFIE
jgi:hypothetical protein